MKRIIKLVLSIFLCQLAGVAGSAFTKPAVDTWYAALEKPFFTPPSWVFAPAWITLYLLMGISAFLIWDRELESLEVKKALGVFLLQLIINASWSMVFFGLKQITLSVIVIATLWLAILWTMVLFYKISKTASFILIPYLSWVSFALLLNVSIWFLN
jgi:translocator protein